jgi:hypothetical protein
MPAKSLAQLRSINSPSGKKALGSKGVKEWNSASKGLKLPERAAKSHSLRRKSVNRYLED